jgi:hypothetical protein
MNKAGHAHTYLEMMEDMVVKYAKRRGEIALAIVL